MKARLLAIVATSCACGGHAPPTAAPAEIIGTWRGTSTCLVRPSACHDETVVYHVTRNGAALALAANKLVDGQEEPMGELACTWTAETRTVRCAIEQGVFVYIVDGDHMTGRLDLTDGTPFRTIDVRRER